MSEGVRTGFSANPIQKNFIESRALADLWAARMGEGKSTGLAWAIFSHTLHNPGANWAVIRDTFENLQKTTMKTFFEWFPPGVYGNYHATKKEFTWYEGVGKGTVSFVGMDDPQDASRFLSWELAGIAMDEPAPAVGSAGIDELIFDLGMTRLRQPGMNWYAMKLAENNPDENHWTYRKFVSPGIDGFVWWQSASPENAANLPENYYETIRRTLGDRPDLVRRFVDGEFGFQSEGRAVTPQWNDRLHLATGLHPLPGREVYALWDFGLCVDGETEVMSENGWRLFKDLNSGERVATWNPESKMVEYHAPLKYITHHAERIWEYENHSISMGMSAEHRVVGYKAETGEWAEYHAEDVADMTNPHLRVVTAGDWPEETGFVPPVNPGLLGFYLAEGTTQGNRVTLYQKAQDPEVQAILDQTPFDWQWAENAKGGYWWTNAPKLAVEFAPLGTATTKRMPVWFRKLGKRDMQTLLHFYIKGDGHYRRNELTAYTTSARLADDLQELGFLVGYSPRIRPRAATKSYYAAEGRWIVSGAGFDIAFRQAQRSDLYPRRYGHWTGDGQVWCVSVPNETLVVRRRGRVHVTGNTPVCILTQVTPMGYWMILDAIAGEEVGIEELIGDAVRPLIATRYPKNPLRHIGDPAGANRDQSSIERSAARMIKKMLGGSKMKPGPVRPKDRIPPLQSVLTRTIDGRGVVQVDRQRAGAVWQALRGGWHYHVARTGLVSENPKKNHPHSDIGDAMSYGAAELFPLGRAATSPHDRVTPGGLIIPGQASYWRPKTGIVPAAGSTLDQMRRGYFNGS